MEEEFITRFFQASYFINWYFIYDFLEMEIKLSINLIKASNYEN